MFENATYTTGATMLEPGDVLVMYSDGITEAEDTFDQPFDEAGVQTRRRRSGTGRRRRNSAGRCLPPSRPIAEERRLLDDLDGARRSAGCRRCRCKLSPLSSARDGWRSRINWRLMCSRSPR